jgi:uncharacterized protein
MMKRRKGIIFSALVAAMVFLLSIVFQAPEVQAKQRRFVSIAAGWVAGAYFPMAGAISRVAYNELRDQGIKVTAESSGASVANAKVIGTGDTDFAILQNDIANYAYNGAKPMFDEPIKNLLGVCTLFPEHVQCIATVKSGIKSISDLKGKRVAIGPVGGGTSENVKQILEIWGVDINDIRTEQLKAEQASDYLKDGRIDAAFYTCAVGAATIVDAALIADLKIIPIGGPNVDKLIEKYPFYAKEIVAGGVYRGTDEDTPTVSVMAMLAARADLEEDLVYVILKAMYDNIKQLRTAHDKFKNISAEKGVVGMSVPFHPGAEKYFKETGIIK